MHKNNNTGDSVRDYVLLAITNKKIKSYKKLQLHLKKKPYNE